MRELNYYQNNQKSNEVHHDLFKFCLKFLFITKIKNIQKSLKW